MPEDTQKHVLFSSRTHCFENYFLPDFINERNKLGSDIGKSSSEDIFRNALLKFIIGVLQ